MKRIISVSIGASERDKKVEIELMGEKYLIERIGTDGSIRKAIELIKSLDGKVDAFGMGGIDLFLSTGTSKRFVINDALPIMQAARITPVADGTGIKNTLEKKVVEYLRDKNIIDLKSRKVLVTCAIDRYKLTEGFTECGCDIVIGDLIFALGIPLPIKKLDTLRRIADIVMPVVSRLPFEMLYPTGSKSSKRSTGRFSHYYEKADIIAGDYHYIKKHMPDDMHGKVIVTNTITSSDVDFLKKRGVSMLVTTTPEWEGRSFGTNVIEAILISASGKSPRELSEDDYYNMLDKLDFKPRIEYLN